MIVQLFVAGSMMFVAAAIHGLVGDDYLRKIEPGALPSNRFGGARSSRMMIRVTWHFVTVTFIALGAMLIAAGVDADAGFASGAVVLTGGLVSAYALITVIAAASGRGLKSLRRHPAPALLSATAALIWWGATLL